MQKMLKQTSCFECLSWKNHVAILGDAVVSCAIEEIAEIAYNMQWRAQLKYSREQEQRQLPTQDDAQIQNRILSQPQAIGENVCGFVNSLHCCITYHHFSNSFSRMLGLLSEHRKTNSSGENNTEKNEHRELCRRFKRLPCAAPRSAQHSFEIISFQF